MRSLQKWGTCSVIYSRALLYLSVYINTSIIGMYVHICWTTLPLKYVCSSRINLCSENCYCDYKKRSWKEHGEYCSNYKIWNKVTLNDYEYRMLVCTEGKFLYLWPWGHNFRHTPTGNLLGSYTPHCNYFPVWMDELMIHLARIIISASSFC